MDTFATLAARSMNNILGDLEPQQREFSKIDLCPGHEYERRGLRNGCGFCKHCNVFANVFEPSEHCTVCGCATYYSRGIEVSTEKEFWYCKEHQHLRPRDTQPSEIDKYHADFLNEES